ncbi:MULTISPECIES: DUF881 domain-containing protein [Romboutsia]|uniref:Division initiation protein n=1 Tax=Romboutsia ilealis TaxID=1115758 RepID=A0A1V1HY53_9FIRM|nr:MULTISPECIES: DUF881 domain-containing protein [Romboutsia]MCI9259301.1 DUF881 domain-containing protein [Romboutsia sp.]CED92891.1 Bacterial protein of unknown function (DUF881) [Romboutsia ilealis]
MKRNYMSIIFIVFIIGLLIGILIKDYNKQVSLYVNKDKFIKNEIKSTQKSIKVMGKEKEKIEKEIEILKSKNQNSKVANQVNTLKEILGYIDVKGSGLLINIDAINDEMGNIANSIDYNKILLNIVNEIKVNGGEYVSINNQRLNQYSEISLAGNHININSTPIAQPYNINVIGDVDKLTDYINKKNTYLDSIGNNYQLRVETKIEKNITIEKLNIINKLENIEGE